MYKDLLLGSAYVIFQPHERHSRPMSWLLHTLKPCGRMATLNPGLAIPSQAFHTSIRWYGRSSSNPGGILMPGRKQSCLPEPRRLQSIKYTPLFTIVFLTIGWTQRSCWPLVGIPLRVQVSFSRSLSNRFSSVPNFLESGAWSSLNLVRDLDVKRPYPLKILGLAELGRSLLPHCHEKA